MAHSSHVWGRNGTPPTIRPHSLEKHKLLEAYLPRYVATLTQNIKIDHLALTLVDGFAGGNIYRDEVTGEIRPGSPSIIINAIRDAERLAASKRTKGFTIQDDYFFIERDGDAYRQLELTLRQSGHASAIGSAMHLINDDFSVHANRIVEFILKKSRSGRAIFILDQCGYDKVPFACVQHILRSVPNAEVIMTFAVDFLIDYLRSRRNRQLSNNPEIDLDALATSVDRSDSRWRRVIQLELHTEVQKLAGARFYTPFFIHSKESHRDLWLVHLSRHHRARDVMVGVHWDLHNCFAHYGGAGLRMLGYRQDEDILHTGQPYFPGFYFDDKAKALTRETLFEELPAHT